MSVPFETAPPRMVLPNSGSVTLEVNIDWVRTTLKEFLEFGFILIVPEPPYCILPLQIKNTSGKLALIHDMSPLNQYVEKSSFKLEGWEEMFDYASTADFAIQFDLKNFYHQIEINPLDKKYFGFTFPLCPDLGPLYFVWNTVPYGYTRAPFIARSLLKPLIAKWRSLGAMVVVFYDDGMAVGKERTLLKKLSSQMHCDLLRAGLVPGIEKCKWQPEKVIVWNGLLFDFELKLLRIKEQRIDNAMIVISDILKCWPKVTFRDVARIVGIIISMQPVFKNLVQLRTRMLQNFVNIKHFKCVSWDCDIQADYKPLFVMAFSELEFWSKFLRSNNYRYFLEPASEWIIWSDASEVAVGGFVAQLMDLKCNTNIWTADNWLLCADHSMPIIRGCAKLQADLWPWSYRKDPPVVRDITDLNPMYLKKAMLCHRNLSLAEKAMDSNERELIAALFIILNCASLLKGATVTLYLDSSNAATIIEKGSPKMRLQYYAGEISRLLIKYSIALNVRWIPRDLNNVADLISRNIDQDDYSVTVEFFRKIQEDAHVRLSIDAFANVCNTKLPRFFGLTYAAGCIGIDAFNYNWSKSECYWVFPPLNMVVKALLHMKCYEANGLFLVPQWKNAHFYPVLRELKNLGFVKNVLVYDGSNVLIQGSDPTSYFGPNFKGNLEVWHLDFSC